MDRRFAGLMVAVICIASVAGLLLGRPAPPAPTLTRALTDSGIAVSGPPAITVHVSGNVLRPGLVVVAEGARVADVIAAAGGATREADLGSVNLAAPVIDGTHVVVPGPSGTGDADSTSDGDRISLNRATPAELERLPGVGPVLAARIVAHRQQVGGFETVEDLLDVAGIGERILAGFRDEVSVP